MSPIGTPETDDLVQRQDSTANTFLDGIWSPDFLHNTDELCELSNASFGLLDNLALQDRLTEENSDEATSTFTICELTDGNLHEKAEEVHQQAVAQMKNLFQGKHLHTIFFSIASRSHSLKSTTGPTMPMYLSFHG